jgi:hypothetical protein
MRAVAGRAFGNCSVQRVSDRGREAINQNPTISPPYLWLAKMAIGIQSKQLADMLQFGLSPYVTDFMLCLLRFLVVCLTRIFRSRRDLLLENLALRQQLVVMKQRYPRPQVSTSDKLFWVILRRLWPEWMHTLIFVQPET